MEHCVALCDYEAMDEGELSFKKGDIITVVAKGTSSGYWEGIIGSTAASKQTHDSNKSSSSGAKRRVASSLNELAGPRGMFPNCFVTSNMRPHVAPTFLDKCIALYSYKARDEHELSMEKDDIVTVVSPCASPGWWTGYNETAAKRMMGRCDRTEQGARAGPSLLDVDVERHCGTPSRPLMFPTNFVSSKIVCASFTFEGRHHHELSMAPGDVVLLHRKWNDGWWEGSIGSRRGIFPSNYTFPNVPTTDPPFFCWRCKSVLHGTPASACKECGKNEEIVSSMLTAAEDFRRGLLPNLDLFAYVDIEPTGTRSSRTSLLTVADTLDRSVRKEK